MTDQSCFQLKGSMIALTILELYHYDYQRFTREMSAKVEQAPDFFKDTPVIISLEKLDPEQHYIDFLELSQLCQEFGMQPLAIRGGSEQVTVTAPVAGLPKLAAQPANRKSRKPAPAQPEAAHNKAPIEPAEPSSTSPSKVIRQPVRSGQQVYARGGDLILLAQVSPGAEVLADGHIHAYAPLRGRALAGVRGDRNANIFCHSLEAELISIAGCYQVSEDLKERHWKQAVQVQLNDNELKIDRLD